ncbi:MAG: ABC transporter ATP-binding protein [Anaerococcus sp.]|nr:ABC transporter ATP-binding protein [Anaerococcus sp.]
MKNLYLIFRRFDKDFKHFTLKLLIMFLILGLLPIINLFAPKIIIENLSAEINLGKISFMLALVLLANTSFLILSQYHDNYFSLVFESMVDRLQFELSEKALNLPIEKTDSKDIQDKLEKAHHSVFSILGLYETIYSVIPSLITALFSIVILVRLSILIPLLLLVIVFVNRIFVRLIKKNELDKQEFDVPDIRVYKYFAQFAQDFKYSKDIKTYDGEDLILEKSKYYMDRMVDRNKLYFNKNGLYQSMMNLSSNLGIVSSLIYLTYKLVKKVISLADFTLYFNAIIQLINTINLLQKNYASIISINENLKAYFEFMDLGEKVDKDRSYKKIDPSKLEIEFKDVSFKYPKSDTYILKSCSFKIRNGETLALVGKNGAGKSTIVKLLCKFYDPTSGKILINGIDLKDIRKEDYYKILSPTFQDFRLFAFKINENLWAKRSRLINQEERDETNKAMKVLKLDKWIEKNENKEETYLTNLFSKKGIEPSGGIGQKLALARSMVHKGKFFIMDEPTSALDPRSEQDIFENMLEISRGQTSLFISHRLSSTKFADRIIVCDKGHISEEGSHEELMKKDGLYRKMFLTQADLYS